MPNREVITQWVAALRSGRYKQTTGKLHRTAPVEWAGNITAPEGFCCLGVLCDLAAKAGVVERYEHFGTVSYGGEPNLLPAAVREWAGLPDNPHVNHVIEWPEGDIEDSTDPLSVLNDDHKYTFDKIADAIEAKFLAKSDAGQPA